jgi:hypothetical protein
MRKFRSPDEWRKVILDQHLKAWCHCALGNALARAGCINLSTTTQLLLFIKDDLKKATLSLATEKMQMDFSLFHGYSGRLAMPTTQPHSSIGL